MAAMKGDMPGKREGLSFVARSDISGGPPIHQNAIKMTMQRRTMFREIPASRDLRGTHDQLRRVRGWLYHRDRRARV